METKRIIEILEKVAKELMHSTNMALELKALSEKDPNFVEKLESFLDHCKNERSR